MGLFNRKDEEFKKQIADKLEEQDKKIGANADQIAKIKKLMDDYDKKIADITRGMDVRTKGYLGMLGNQLNYGYQQQPNNNLEKPSYGYQQQSNDSFGGKRRWKAQV